MVEKYNGLDYEMQCAIKGEVKNVGKANFGYYRSYALSNAGKKLLVWKAVWSCRRIKQILSKIIKNNIEKMGYNEKEIARLSLMQICKEMRIAVQELKDFKREASKMG